MKNNKCLSGTEKHSQTWKEQLFEEVQKQTDDAWISRWDSFWFTRKLVLYSLSNWYIDNNKKQTNKWQSSLLVHWDYCVEIESVLIVFCVGWIVKEKGVC